MSQCQCWAGRGQLRPNPRASSRIFSRPSHRWYAKRRLDPLEAAASDPDIHVLIADRELQRQGTAGWIVDGVMARAALRPELDRNAAIDTVWLLMDPVIFSRLTRNRAWSADRYASWFAASVTRLLTSDHS